MTTDTNADCQPGRRGRHRAPDGQAGECHCIVRHAITGKDTAQAAGDFEDARAMNDASGMLTALIQLTGPCAARLSTEDGAQPAAGERAVVVLVTLTADADDDRTAQEITAEFTRDIGGTLGPAVTLLTPAGLDAERCPECGHAAAGHTSTPSVTCTRPGCLCRWRPGAQHGGPDPVPS